VSAREVIEECRAALAEELAAWDIDPPLHHVKQAHDKCVAWLAENPPTGSQTPRKRSTAGCSIKVRCRMTDAPTGEKP
jgi:hypothetical protein